MDLKKLPALYRGGEIETRADGEGANGKRTHRFSVSSETPIERWFGNEILSHASNAIDATYLRRGLPVMADDRLGGHNGVQVGIFENGKVENGKLRGDVRFSSSVKAQEVETDVTDGIRTQVSLGYQVKRFKVAKGTGNGTDTYTATRWIPREVTILPMGADISVGPGRSADSTELEFDVEVEYERAADAGPEEETMERNERGTQAPETRSPEPAAAPATPETAPPSPAVQVGETRNFSAEAVEIVELCNANGVSERAAEYIRDRRTPDQVGRAILELKRTEGFAAPAAEGTDPPATSKRDAGRYSYRRAILQLVTRGVGATFDGLEGEVHTELLRRMPENGTYRGGIMVPMRVRALDSMTSGAGVETVDTDRGEFIELLRNRTRCVTMGARLLSGLSGPVAFTKQTGGISVGWVGENPGADGPDSDLALGQVLMGPKTLQGSTGYSRQLLAQASLDVERLVRDDLAAGHGLAYDLAAIHGIGAGGQPIGIYNAPDVQAKAFGGVPTHALLVDMQGLVADANADEGSLGYMTNPLTAALLKKTPEHATAAMGNWIWDGPVANGMVAGYRATATKQVSGTLGAGSNEQGIIFGNWADLMIGVWGAMELIVDPYSKKKQALIEVTSFQMADVAIRHGESFCKATGATLS